jgi:hypothetical protein
MSYSFCSGISVPEFGLQHFDYGERLALDERKMRVVISSLPFEEDVDSEQRVIALESAEAVVTLLQVRWGPAV